MKTGERDAVPAPPGAIVCPSATGELSDPQLLEQFAARHDQAAFATLVRRHGPLVLGVCQRVLGDRHEAEDAFQVTFLVLARRAGFLARPELLANWLYGVAYRATLKARGRAARRRETERRVARMPQEDHMSPDDGKELCAALDEELGRLPEKYRAPVVLCYLGGKTNEEAARLLGCPPGSMSRRLARGRQLLRARVASRCGVDFDLRFCSRGLLAQHDLPAAVVPEPLTEATTRAAVIFAARCDPAPPGLSDSSAALAEEVLRALAASPWRRRAAVLAALVLAVLGAALLAYVLGV